MVYGITSYFTLYKVLVPYMNTPNIFKNNTFLSTHGATFRGRKAVEKMENVKKHAVRHFEGNVLT